MNQRAREAEALQQQKEELEKALEVRERELENKIEEALSANKELKKDLNDSFETLDKIEKALEKAKREKDECEEKLKMLHASIQSKTTDNEQILKQLENAMKNNKNLENTIQELEQKLAEATIKNDEIHLELENTRKILEELKSNTTQNEKDKQELLDKAVTEMDDLRRKIEEQTKAHDYAAMQLRATLVAQKKEIEKLTKISEEQHEEIEIYIDVIRQSYKTNAEFDNQLAEGTTETEELKNQIAELFAVGKEFYQNRRLNKEIYQKFKTLMQKQSKDEPIEDSLDQFMKGREKVVKKFEELNEQIRELQSAGNTASVQEVEDLTRELHAARQTILEMQGQSEDISDANLQSIREQWDNLFKDFTYEDQNALYEQICAVMPDKTTKELSFKDINTKTQKSVNDQYKAIFLPQRMHETFKSIIVQFCNAWQLVDRDKDFFVTKYYKGKWFDKLDGSLNPIFSNGQQWKTPNLDWLYQIVDGIFFFNCDVLENVGFGNLKIFFDQRSKKLSNTDPAKNNRQDRLNKTHQLDFESLQHAFQVNKFFPAYLFLISITPKLKSTPSLSGQKFLYPFNSFPSISIDFGGCTYFDAVRGGVFKMYKSTFSTINSKLERKNNLWTVPVKEATPDLFDADDFFKGFNLR